MHDLIYGRNAVYETLLATRRQVFELQVAETARQAGRMAQILDLATSAQAQDARVCRIPISLGPRLIIRAWRWRPVRIRTRTWQT